MRAIVAFILLTTAVFAAVPSIQGRVNDFAGVLTLQERDALTTKLRAIEEKPGKPQVAIVLPASMDGLDIERYSHDVASAWRIGQAKRDNGVLIVIAPKERKWRIEVGYGLEGQIPDARAKAIITEALDPHLKGGKTAFYAALDAAVDKISADLDKEAAVVGPLTRTQSTFGVVAIFGGIAAFAGLVVLGIAVSNRREERERKREQKEWEERSAKRRVTAAAAAAGAFAAGSAIHPTTTRAQRPLRTPPPAPEPERKAYTPPEPKRRRRDDDSPSFSSSSSSSSDWGSSSSSSSSSDSFSGGGGSFGGGGASGGD